MNDIIMFYAVQCDLSILKGKVVDHTKEVAYQTQTQKLFIQPHIIQSKFSHTLRFNIMGQ